MPRVATDIMECIVDEMVEFDVAAKIIERDPALVARLISLANSSFFAPPREIETIRDAMSLSLGLDVTRTVSVGMACASSFNVSGCPEFCTEDYWLRSLKSAEICKAIAASSPTGPPVPTAGLAGMLCDIGLLALAVTAPKELSLALRSEQAVSDALCGQLGFTHQDMAAAVATSWALPEPVVVAFVNLASGKPNCRLSEALTLTNGILFSIERDDSDDCAEKLSVLAEELGYEIPSSKVLNAQDEKLQALAVSMAA